MEFTKKDLLHCLIEFKFKLEIGAIETDEEINDYAEAWTTN